MIGNASGCLLNKSNMRGLCCKVFESFGVHTLLNRLCICFFFFYIVSTLPHPQGVPSLKEIQ